jgi:hypothetical protein
LFEFDYAAKWKLKKIGCEWNYYSWMNKILLKRKNFFLLKKKLKFLLEIVIDDNGNFQLSPKLNLLLNQNNIFELDKLTIFIKTFFEKITLNSLNNKIAFSFFIPIIFIFPRNEIHKTNIYILNPINTFFLLTIFRLNIKFIRLKKNKVKNILNKKKKKKFLRILLLILFFGFKLQYYVKRAYMRKKL